jgi:hypothetical protein
MCAAAAAQDMRLRRLPVACKGCWDERWVSKSGLKRRRTANDSACWRQAVGCSSPQKGAPVVRACCLASQLSEEALGGALHRGEGAVGSGGVG